MYRIRIDSTFPALITNITHLREQSTQPSLLGLFAISILRKPPKGCKKPSDMHAQFTASQETFKYQNPNHFVNALLQLWSKFETNVRYHQTF